MKTHHLKKKQKNKRFWGLIIEVTLLNMDYYGEEYLANACCNDSILWSSSSFPSSDLSNCRLVASRHVNAYEKMHWEIIHI